jgi:two-component system, NarL family, sensor histidine kinase LiaS
LFGQELNGMAGELERLLRERGDLAGLEARNRLARDLHDSVKQQITAASFQIGAAAALLEKDLPGARACLGEAETLAHQAHQELNSIIFELRPAGLKAGGLAASLREYVEGWGRQNPVAVRTRFQGEWNPGLDVQEDLLRFVQEGLSNVARHSQATQVEISLAVGERQVTLSIQDNGQGFEGSPAGEGGYGLKTMRERVEAAGGSFTFESHPGQGTLVSATIPQMRETDGKDA